MVALDMANARVLGCTGTSRVQDVPVGPTILSFNPCTLHLNDKHQLIGIKTIRVVNGDPLTRIEIEHCSVAVDNTGDRWRGVLVGTGGERKPQQ